MASRFRRRTSGEDGVAMITAVLVTIVASMLSVTAVQLAMQLNIPVVRINARTGEGMTNLHDAVSQVIDQKDWQQLQVVRAIVDAAGGQP